MKVDIERARELAVQLQVAARAARDTEAEEAASELVGLLGE
jgi:hypothetical protein